MAQMKQILLLSAAGLSFFLAGCGFRPLYNSSGDAANEGLSALDTVAIDIIPDREGQMLRNALIDTMYRAGYPSSPAATLHVGKLSETRTELDITKTSEATRTLLRLATKITLTGTDGKVLLSRDVQTVGSYNILQSEFATRVTEESARENAIRDLARQIQETLLLYYNDNRP